MRAAFLALFLALLLQDSVQAQTLNPYPCPTPATEFVDPTFVALPGARAFFGRYEGGPDPIQWTGDVS